MGYCYGYKSKKLVCDCCSTEGARKRKCPCGYCPATALCPTCYKAVKSDGRWVKAHENCQKGHDEFVARDNRELALLASGAYVRCSAMNAGNLVHVLFENKYGEVIGKYMRPETYSAIYLLEPATVEDYAKIGALMDGPKEYDFGGTSKQVEAVLV